MLQGERVDQEQQNQSNDLFRDVGCLFNSVFQCPSLSKVMRGRTEMRATGFASLLLGIASALILLGSLAFFLGLIMMPMVATLALTFSFIGILHTCFPFNPSHLLTKTKMVLGPQ
ncbi:hypothetical protein SUGI_0456610 [Cryptomeria japonica]|nr:hypothetical protein SUGI_0456610 [Cryptomeria japonica]